MSDFAIGFTYTPNPCPQGGGELSCIAASGHSEADSFRVTTGRFPSPLWGGLVVGVHAAAIPI